MSQFWEKYRDPRWQRKRLEVMEAAGFSCEACGDGSATLNVHHKHYRKNADPWEYGPGDLICLCEPCHEQWHRAKVNFEVAIGFLDLDGYRHVVGYAIGRAILSGECPPDIKLFFAQPSGMDGLAIALGLNITEIDGLRGPDGAAFSGDLLAASMEARRPSRKSKRNKKSK